MSKQQEASLILRPDESFNDTQGTRLSAAKAAQQQGKA